jgi:hypothetical protein
MYTDVHPQMKDVHGESTGSGGDQGPVRMSEQRSLNATGRDDQATLNPVVTVAGTHPVHP